MQDLIKSVRAHAIQNYEVGGWDYIVESYDDEEIEEILTAAGVTTVEEAIEVMGRKVGDLSDYRDDIESTIF